MDSYSGSLQEASDRRNAASASEKAASATAMASHTSAAGLGSLQKSKKSPPKSSDYNGDMRLYSEAMRKYRTEMDNDPEAQAQKKALQRMK